MPPKAKRGRPRSKKTSEVSDSGESFDQRTSESDADVPTEGQEGNRDDETEDDLPLRKRSRRGKKAAEDAISEPEIDESEQPVEDAPMEQGFNDGIQLPEEEIVPDDVIESSHKRQADDDDYLQPDSKKTRTDLDEMGQDAYMDQEMSEEQKLLMMEARMKKEQEEREAAEEQAKRDEEEDMVNSIHIRCCPFFNGIF